MIRFLYPGIDGERAGIRGKVPGNILSFRAGAFVTGYGCVWITRSARGKTSFY